MTKSGRLLHVVEAFLWFLVLENNLRKNGSRCPHVAGRYFPSKWWLRIAQQPPLLGCPAALMAHVWVLLGTLRLVLRTSLLDVSSLYMSLYVLNQRYSISPSHHTPKLHHKALRHTSSSSTSFHTSSTFLDVWPPNTSKLYIVTLNNNFSHFKTLLTH